jgi:hypothetical protein
MKLTVLDTDSKDRCCFQEWSKAEGLHACKKHAVASISRGKGLCKEHAEFVADNERGLGFESATGMTILRDDFINMIGVKEK